MSEWKNGKSVVYEDRHGNTRCSACCSPLWCNDNGDMPDTCPQCGAPLDYSAYTYARKADDATTSPKYYHIDENMARRAHDMMSMRDYKEGSTTAEYRRMVDKAAELAEQQKRRVDPMYHDKIDRLLDTYARKLAENMNQASRIGTMCPSILIAGGSNFNVGKKNRQNAASDRNMAEYRQIQELLHKIKSVGTGGISSDDPNAVDKLREKLEGHQKLQQTMKAVNAYYRKHKTLDGCPDLTDAQKSKIEGRWAMGWYTGIPFPTYELSNNNATIHRIQKRVEELEKRQTEAAPDGWDFDGGRVVVNTELNRLQIVLDCRPDDNMKQAMKSHGFRWAPSQGAWQRQLTNNAIWDAKAITKAE